MLPVISFVLYFLLANATYYKSESGKVSFESKANMEKIKASSKGLRGIIRAENNTFHFEVILNSFQGLSQSDVLDIINLSVNYNY